MNRDPFFTFPRIDRSLKPGVHPYCRLMPQVHESPALVRIFASVEVQERVIASAHVHIRNERSFAWVDVEVPCIVLSEWYYQEGHERDLYLDLLHELTHLRQLEEGHDLWDERFEYVDRPTEIEGYAVAIEEGRRLGMVEAEIVQHLSNPWMTDEDVRRLLASVEEFLARSR